MKSLARLVPAVLVGLSVLLTACTHHVVHHVVVHHHVAMSHCSVVRHYDRHHRYLGLSRMCH